MEIKNNGVDLLLKQQMGSRKTDEKQQLDELGGFKTMLKNKGQNKDEKTQEKQEQSDSEAVVNAAVLGGTSNVETAPLVQPQEVLTEDKALNGLEEAFTLTASETMQELPGMGPYQTMDQFRFQQLSGKSTEQNQPMAFEVQPDQNELKTAATETDGFLEAVGDEPNTSKSQENLQLKAETPFKQQAKVPEPVQEEHKSADQPVTVKSLSTEHEAVKEPVGTLKPSRDEKTAFDEKENKNAQEALGIFQEKPHETGRVLHMRTAKPETVYATVRADNREELEAGLSKQLLSQIQAGRKELDVQLEPVNLGKIRIKVSYEEGQVSVSVLCTESKTLKLLSQSASDLGSILESNLERPVQILVDKQEADYLNNQQEQNNGQGRQEQHSQKQQSESSEDFVQKLRLGILGLDSQEDSYTDYRL